MSLTRSKDTEQSVQKTVQSSPSVTSFRPYLRAARRTGENSNEHFHLEVLDATTYYILQINETIKR